MASPNNPTGKLYSQKELEQLAELAREKDLIVVSDEVYEWMIYPGNEMVRFGLFKPHQPKDFTKTLHILQPVCRACSSTSTHPFPFLH
jgi:aspartate/methionine/tyrosine aminotransferase